MSNEIHYIIYAPGPEGVSENRRQRWKHTALNGFRIDRTEVSVERFAAFLKATGRVSQAEREGAGVEWGAGWEKRPGWSFRAPSGVPARPDDPAAPR